MKVLFVTGYGPITTDTKESAAFYRESLGLSFKEEADGYFHTEELKGVNSFALEGVEEQNKPIDSGETLCESCLCGRRSKRGDIRGEATGSLVIRDT
jgi:catechol 2,3-dioxygenase-like lactoylglutathione lyase family enzyme